MCVVLCCVVLYDDDDNDGVDADADIEAWKVPN